MKQFHIVNVGNSLLDNFIKCGKVETHPMEDNNFWEAKLKDSIFMNDVYNFICSDPERNSAELNSLLKFKKKYAPELANSNMHIYLIGTQTPSNEICKRRIERYLRDNDFTVYSGIEVSGYFEKPPSVAVDKFIEGIATMLDRILNLALRKKEEGFEVFFVPTGGFKPHVITCALAGFMANCEVYYIHEEFKDVIRLPRQLYLPKGREFDLLMQLFDKRPRRGEDFSKLSEQYKDEIERLLVYGLVDIEEDEHGRKYGIKITEKGRWVFDELKQFVS